MLAALPRVARSFFTSSLGAVAMATACSAGSGGKSVGGATTGRAYAAGGTVPVVSSPSAARRDRRPSRARASRRQRLRWRPRLRRHPRHGRARAGGRHIMLDISGSMLTDTGTRDQPMDRGKAPQHVLDDQESAVSALRFSTSRSKPPAYRPRARRTLSARPRWNVLDEILRALRSGLRAMQHRHGLHERPRQGRRPCEANLVAACNATERRPVHRRPGMPDFAPNVGPGSLGRCAQDMTLSAKPGTLCSAGNMWRGGTAACSTRPLHIRRPTPPGREFGELPGAAGAIVASINAQMPRGETPSRPALRGAIVTRAPGQPHIRSLRRGGARDRRPAHGLLERQRDSSNLSCGGGRGRRGRDGGTWRVAEHLDVRGRCFRRVGHRGARESEPYCSRGRDEPSVHGGASSSAVTAVCRCAEGHPQLAPGCESRSPRHQTASRSTSTRERRIDR